MEKTFVPLIVLINTINTKEKGYIIGWTNIIIVRTRVGGSFGNEFTQ
jgi:hypothetical protein